MPSNARSTILNPKILAPQEKERLIDTLYPLHSQIFSGHDRPLFVRKIIEADADDTMLMLMRDRQGQLGGYCAVHQYEHMHNGKPIGLLRFQAGLLPAFRGRNRSVPFVLMQLLRHRFSHPMRPLYFFGVLIHPSSYLLCTKYVAGFGSIKEQKHSPDLGALLRSCAQRFGMTPVDPANPMIVHMGLHTQDDQLDQHYWQHCTKPEVRRYLDLNPGFARGHGLVTLIPCSFSGIFIIAWRLARNLLVRSLSRWRARMQLAGDTN
jgi:hypothetical protein